MTTVIRGTDDSASTPALTGTDTDTGVFFPAANTMAMSTGGSERMRINSSGNVGIGTTSPSSRLHVASASDPTITVQNTAESTMTLIAGGNGQIRSTTALDMYTNGTLRSRITSGGNILFGSDATWDTGTGSSFYIANNSDKSPLRVSSGDPGSPPYGLIAFHRNKGSLIARISTDGSTVAYNTSSDYRLKENIAPMSGALEKVLALNPVTYTWKETGKNGEGFIAHELAEVCPDAVSGEKDAVETIIDEEGNEQVQPIYQGVDTSFLVATLTAAIQELKAINDAQASRIETLEAKVAALEAK